MAFRYNDDSGDFEEVPSAMERIGKFFRTLLRVIFRIVCWAVVVVLVGGGGAAAWKYRGAFGETLSAANSDCSAWCGKVWNSCATWLGGLGLTSVRQVGDWIGANGRYVFICLAGLLLWKFRKLIWLVVSRTFAFVFYPIAKWWGFVKESWQNGDRFPACVMILPGFVLFGLYQLLFGIVASVVSDSFSVSGSWDAVKMILAIGGFVLFVVFYGRALSEARYGRLVVYRDWGDFAKSVVWLVAFPPGILWMFDGQTDFLFRCVGLASVVIGALSFWTMVSGAFKYNSGSSRWLSLFARIGVILLLAFAFGRIQEKLEQYKRRKLGVIRGVIIPMIVFAWMFNYLIRPMIWTENRLWSIRRTRR